VANLAWFPFYVADFLSSRRTRTMDAEQVGVYLLLLCEQWDHGPIPDDPDEIADITRTKPGSSQASAVLQRCFTLTDEGWVNERLEEVRTEQEAKSARLSEAGRRGGVKSGKARGSKPGLSHPQAPLHRSQAQARLKPGSSIRREEIREEEKREPVLPSSNQPPPQPVVHTEHHQELHTWLGTHAGCLEGVPMMAQRSIWGIWGPTGTTEQDWRDTATDDRPPILASAILSWTATDQGTRFYRPFFAKILARAIDHAIANARQATEAEREREGLGEMQDGAHALEAIEVARLNDDGKVQAGRVKRAKEYYEAADEGTQRQLDAMCAPTLRKFGRRVPALIAGAALADAVDVLETQGAA